MDIALITGSGGLVGSEAVNLFAHKGFKTIGIDNDYRAIFFGKNASTAWNVTRLSEQHSDYEHWYVDIRDDRAIDQIFNDYGSDIKVIIHTAAQPSHDWATEDPKTDFSINANGTLNLLASTRKHCPDAVFIFTSTNKVYGDTPNFLPLVEMDTRWEVSPEHQFHKDGIDETMSIDAAKHSLFGVSKIAADLMVQEYGRYFGLKTVCFRGGCLTGPSHSGAKLHGFLSYLMKCVVKKEPYTIYGYKAKQVRDNIHAKDLVNCFYAFYQNPRIAEVYNIGGSRFSNCSMLEAIDICEKISGNKFDYQYSDESRIGDHIWWISDVSKFQSHYPEWSYQYNIENILTEIYQAILEH